jgi:hypothetical protein
VVPLLLSILALFATLSHIPRGIRPLFRLMTDLSFLSKAAFLKKNKMMVIFPVDVSLA